MVVCSLQIITAPLVADVVVDPSQVDSTIRKIKAAHFLTQATMGPRYDEINALADQMAILGETEAMNQWIDNQFATVNIGLNSHALTMITADGFEPAARSSDYPDLDLGIQHYRRYGWWDQAVNGEDQLRQRMSWALAQIFVANDTNSRTTWQRTTHYYDMLKENAFGNYRELLEDVTYHPVMGKFLSHLKNDKGDPALGIYPDENYAREVMQLFSIGVYQTSGSGRPALQNGVPVENYTNEDIENLARVFTGLGYLPRNQNTMGFYDALPANYRDPMIMYEEHHDTGEKVFLGNTIPAGQSGDEDISQALDILFNHATTGQFIAQRLIQRFTCSTPHAHYILRVRNVFRDNGAGVRGDLQAVIRQILMDPHARDVLAINQTTLQDGNVLITVTPSTTVPQAALQGRLREPVLQMSHFLRFFEVDSIENETNSFEGYFKPALLYSSTQQDISQQVSVFNYYSADFLPASGPAANRVRTSNDFALPEFELLPAFAIPLTEGIKNMAIHGEVDQRATVFSQPAILNRLLAYSDQDEMENSFEWLVNELNIYMCYGTMSDSLQQELIQALNNLTDATQEQKFANAIAVLMSTADYAVTD